MKIRQLLVFGALGTILLAGCVSSTTGRVQPLADNEDAAKLNYELGARYYKKGSYELARDRLLLATELNPQFSVAYTTLALTYEALENERLAIDAYEDALRVAPRNFDVQNAYAVFLCRQERFDKARVHFEKAIKHPENDQAYKTLTNAGVCASGVPDEALAESYFREALEHKSNYGEALLQICILKFRQEDFLSSRAFLQRYMSSNPTSAGVLLLASRIEGELDNTSGRVEYEDELLRSFPNSPEARKIFGSD